MALFGSKDKTPEAPTLQFEKIVDKGAGLSTDLRRAKVLGGWLIVAASDKGTGLVFIPDVCHEWNVRTT